MISVWHGFKFNVIYTSRDKFQCKLVLKSSSISRIAMGDKCLTKYKLVKIELVLLGNKL